MPSTFSGAQDTARTVGRNTVAAALLRFSVLGVWFVLTPQVLRALGPDRFGFWSILLALGGSFIAVDLGLGVAVTRAVARLHHAGDRAALESMLKRVTLVQFAVATVLGALVLVFTPSILGLFRVPAVWSGEASRALACAVGGFVFGTLANLFVAALQGLQRMDRVAPIGVAFALALGAAVPWALGRPTPLVGLTALQFAYAVGTAIGYGIVLARAAHAELPKAEGAGSDVALGELLRVGGWVQANAVLALLQAQFDKVLLGALVALAPVASYELGARVTGAMMVPSLLFVGSLLPAFARAAAQDAKGALSALYLAAMDPYFALVLGIVGAAIALAPWILATWLGTPPAWAVPCLVALALTQAGSGVTGVASTLVRARGDLRLEFLYGVLSTGLHVALSIVGLRLGGPSGLLVGTAASSIVTAIWYVQRVDSSLDSATRGRVGRHLAPFLASAGTAGAAAYLLASALAGRGAALALAAGGVLYLVAFAATLRLGFGGTWRSLVARGQRLKSRPA